METVKLTPRTSRVLKVALEQGLARHWSTHRTFDIATGDTLDPLAVQICLDYGWIELPDNLATRGEFGQLKLSFTGSQLLGYVRTGGRGKRKLDKPHGAV